VASHSAPLARPQDEGSALSTVEDENAASGVEGRQNRPISCQTVHYEQPLVVPQLVQT
jgi:hypothetical protein